MSIFAGFIFFILLILLFVLILVLSFVARFWSIIKILFGKNKQNERWNMYTGNNYTFHNQQNRQEETNKNRKTTISGDPKRRNSTIDKDEGEYVDFEEIP